MDKISNSEDDNGALHNVEGFVLDRLSSKHDSGGDPLVGIGDLESIDTTMSSLLDQAIEDNRPRTDPFTGWRELPNYSRWD
jgi:hypothetical protein